MVASIPQIQSVLKFFVIKIFCYFMPRCSKIVIFNYDFVLHSGKTWNSTWFIVCLLLHQSLYYDLVEFLVHVYIFPQLTVFIIDQKVISPIQFHSLLTSLVLLSLIF
jgi:hypothetical protein